MERKGLKRKATEIRGEREREWRKERGRKSHQDKERKERGNDRDRKKQRREKREKVE